MNRIDINFLSQEYRLLDELEERVEKLKDEKAKYVKGLEKRFRKRCTSAEAQRRLKDHLDRNPEGAEMKRLKSMEDKLHHVIKQLDRKKQMLDTFVKNKETE